MGGKLFFTSGLIFGLVLLYNNNNCENVIINRTMQSEILNRLEKHFDEWKNPPPVRRMNNIHRMNSLKLDESILCAEWMNTLYTWITLCLCYKRISLLGLNEKGKSIRFFRILFLKPYKIYTILFWYLCDKCERHTLDA